jgi:hypothetical protein
MLMFDKLLEDYQEAIVTYEHESECGTVQGMERARIARDAAKEALRKHFAERMR